jgi:hypothetical protein
VSAGCAVTVAEHLKDRDGAGEMLRGERRIILLHREQTIETLSLARNSQIGRGLSCFVGDLMQ